MHTNAAATLNGRNRTPSIASGISRFPIHEAPTDGSCRADGTPIRVLVIDAEQELADMVAQVLRYERWETTTVPNGATAVKIARATPPDIVVLDIMLPDMDGLDVLAELRTIKPGLPVLLLTAKRSVEDRIAGFTAGGDDYIIKPCSLEELVLRMRAVLRRTTSDRHSPCLVVGDLVLDERSHEASRGGAVITLTATEFELLRYLMQHAGKVVSKGQILRQVWDYDFGGRANIVEIYVSYLRKKIDCGRVPMIHTLRGAGYVLRPARARQHQASFG